MIMTRIHWLNKKAGDEWTFIRFKSTFSEYFDTAMRFALHAEARRLGSGTLNAHTDEETIYQRNLDILTFVHHYNSDFNFWNGTITVKQGINGEQVELPAPITQNLVGALFGMTNSAQLRRYQIAVSRCEEIIYRLLSETDVLSLLLEKETRVNTFLLLLTGVELISTCMKGQETVPTSDAVRSTIESITTLSKMSEKSKQSLKSRLQEFYGFEQIEASDPGMIELDTMLEMLTTN